MSLVASATVAATIVATHQVAQRFASGAVGAFNQQQAYVLAQKSLAVAGLMVNRNVILCSNIPKGAGGRAVGCNWKEPLADDSLARELYNSLKLDTTWFNVGNNIDNNNHDAYAQYYLTLKNPKENYLGSVFKNAEVTWALRSLKDTNLRSISGAFSKGYTCRNVNTFDVIEEGYCDLMDEDRSDEEKFSGMLSNLDSHLLSDENKKCRTVDTTSDNKIDKDDDVNDSRNDDSVCDYYAHSDGDTAIVFISVKVPYQVSDAEEEGSKNLIVNAAIRRPMSIIKTQIKEDSSMCPVSCIIAKRTNMGSSNVDFPECAGFASGNQNGEQYFSDNIHTVETKLKLKNYGPGVLYGISLLKEDIDPRTGLLLGRSMVSFQDSDPSSLADTPLEPAHLTTNPPDVEEGVRVLAHHTPCYSSNFYKPNLQRITCDCELNPPDPPDPTTGSKNTANGVICMKGTSVCAGKNIFVSNVPGVLQDDSTTQDARNSLSGCFHAPGTLEDLPTLSNAVVTAFEKPCIDATDCQFTRIDNDQISTTKESWCGNDYVGNDPSTKPTGRELRPTDETQVAFPDPVESTVFSAANQADIPLTTPSP